MKGRMNTLLMVVLTVQAPALEPAPVIQTQAPGGTSFVSPMPSTSAVPPVITSGEVDSGEGWFSRFRNRPGLIGRLRGWFGWGQSSEPVMSSPTPSYPISTGSWNESRLTPVPASTTPSYPTSTAPSVSYGAPPLASPSLDTGSAQRMPVGR
jgi:hypothetical protein